MMTTDDPELIEKFELECPKFNEPGVPLREYLRSLSAWLEENEDWRDK
tara:strand:- start:13870 stop:14013 length:144 start_codon:yes stop_codon:yes gene_type:complete